MIKESFIPLFFIFTGGPGSGKTTILEVLKKKYTISSESGREIIREQQVLKGNATPWNDKKLFRDLMIERDIEKYLDAKNHNQIVLFDRGILDSIGYSVLENIPISKEILKKIEGYPYQKQIFLFPPWEQIYLNDKERKQSFEEAMSTYNAIKKVYISRQYSIFEVPKTTIKQRCLLIEKEIRRLANLARKAPLQ